MKNYIKWLFGADSKEFETAMERMKRKAHDASVVIAKSLTGIIAAAIAVTTKVIFDSISYFDNLQHKSEQLGQSVSFIAAFEAAFRQAGGSIQQADKAISDFSRKWGEAVAGSGELIAVLDTLRISTTNLDGTTRTAKEGMFLFADMISKTKDPAQKLFLATKAFGEEGGAKMVEVLNGGADGMARLIAQFEIGNPEIDQHAKSLSEAKAQLKSLWDATLLFAGSWVGKIKEMFITRPEEALANFKTFALEMLFGFFEVVGAIMEKITFGRVKADQFLEEMRQKLDAAAQQRMQDAIDAAEEREESEDDITQSIIEQSDAYKAQLKELEKLRNDEAMRSGQVADRNKEIIHTLIEQGLTLDLIAARYPNMKSAIEANKTEYEKAAEAVAKIKENVDAATDATNDLADAAGKVDYPNGPTGGYGGGGGGTSTGNIGTPDENWRTRDGLANTGSSGSGVTGVFAGQYEDLSSMSVAEMLRIADELEETLKGINKNVGGSGITGPTGGLGLDKIYADTIKQILDNINKELYYRAKEEAGSKGGLIPAAGFMSPEKYFEKLDDFIEKLYEKETEKDGAMKQTQQAAQTQTEATKKLQNALERFSSSLERSQSSRFGVSLRP
jgi:hypothetical protein